MLITTIKEKYNPETALAVLCCRHYIQTVDNDYIRIFIEQNVIDWGKFYQLSKAHRIVPVCYKVLFKFKDIIGYENLEDLRNYCIYFNAFSLNNKQELNRLVKLLRQNDIEVKPFKGIDFAESFYEDIALRDFSDIDIIIKAVDIERLIEVMTKDGYYSEGIKFYNKFPLQYIRYYKDIAFIKKNTSGREFLFEFHFKPAVTYQGYPFSFKEVLGKDYLIESKKLNATDHLKLMILNNGLMDFYPNLRSVLDLAVIFKRGENINPDNFDPLIKRYLNYGRVISFELLNSPIILPATILTYKEVKFCDQLSEHILNIKGRYRMHPLKYILK
ncbi:MAG: nucleotidyltransferase family protein [Chitinophagaceae bacterium]|nr:nucleotidyltransferase family protein [Chitinophagaceae bacterium]